MIKRNVSINVAENCGFCFGVRRAVDTVYKLRKSTDKKIYVVGELIHNETFIKRLEKDGVYCIDERDTDRLLHENEDAVFVIRTHGATKQLSEKLLSSGKQIVDATCPFVKRIHKIVEENSPECDCTLIIGDRNHPEVIGIRSYAKGDTEVCLNDEECSQFVNKSTSKKLEKPLLVSQTTGNNEKYVNCQKIIKKLYTKAKIFDTICNVTENRQNEVKNMAECADIMCIIGCTKSSNTKKLYEIALAYCDNVFLMESAADVPDERFRELYRVNENKGKDGCEADFTVGITAGASTPDDIIQEVKVRIEEIFNSDEKQNDGHIND